MHLKALSRVGLVVGVDKYDQLESLKNPVNDAILIENTLAARSFDIVTPQTGSRQEIEQAITVFEAAILQASADGEPVFKVAYFAGHGVEVAGAAYFLPSDFPSRVSPGSLGYCGISLQRIVEAMSACAGPSVIILDMCRVTVDTSLPADLSALSDLVKANRELYTKAAEAHDILIAYSTSAGDEAGDGPGSNSRYTEVLCKLMLRYEMSTPEVFSEATVQVIVQTAAKQRPWQYTSLLESIRFSDLSRLKLVASFFLNHPASKVSRLQAVSDLVFYYNKSEVLVSKGLESKVAVRVPTDVEALAVTPRGLLIADGNGELHWDEDSGLRTIGKHGVKNLVGLEVSPSGIRFVAFGMHAYSVMSLSTTGVLNMDLPAKRHQKDFYGATWIDDDRLVLCCSNGTLTEVTFSAKGPKAREINLKHQRPIYDAEVLTRYNMLAVSAAAGRIDFLDLATLNMQSRRNLSHEATNRSETYNSLREAGFAGEVALSYLDDPEAFLAKHPNSKKLHLLTDALPIRNLICLSQTSDPRLLAVGAEDGFVFLIDIRTQNVADVIDAGGGRGETLAWMTTTADGAIVSLSANSVMSRYQLTPPRC